MFSRNYRIIILSIIILLCSNLYSLQQKALWVTPWDMNSVEKIQQVVENSSNWGITDLLVEVRYRGDALYIPNKNCNKFYNPEPISYILNNQEIDPLQLFIDEAKKKNIRIHAWVTVLVATPRVIENIANNHLYHTKRNWFTYNSLNDKIHYSQFEGAYLDPGLCDVKEYLVNVFSDIVSNYDIDGLHLDYIRYPGSDYGYHKTALNNYRQFKKDIGNIGFSEWKEKQISELISKINHSVKNIKPDIELSAAVIADIENARLRYSQNWFDFINQNLLDKVYIMAYQANDSDFRNVINKIPERFHNNIIVGLRAWTDNNNYTNDCIKSKISIVNNYNNFQGIAFFSYNGIIQRRFQPAIKSFNIALNQSIKNNFQKETSLNTNIYKESISDIYPLTTDIYKKKGLYFLDIINTSNQIAYWQISDLDYNIIYEGLLDDKLINFILPDFIIEKQKLILTCNIDEIEYKKILNLENILMRVEEK